MLSPGPIVTATASKSDSFTPACRKTSWTVPSIASLCASMASEGTTPPQGACISICDKIHAFQACGCLYCAVQQYILLLPRELFIGEQWQQKHKSQPFVQLIKSLHKLQDHFMQQRLNWPGIYAMNEDQATPVHISPLQWPICFYAVNLRCWCHSVCWQSPRV